MKFTPSTEQDIERLSDWIMRDPYHKNCLDPIWWLTGQGLLSYRIEDYKGVTMYARFDEDNQLLRLHCQFAPESEVSKLRVIKSIMWAIPRMEQFARQNNTRGLIYKSVNPNLIEFMKAKFGFVSSSDDDYVKLFETQVGT